MAADAPAETRLEVSAAELRHWRRDQLRLGGTQAEVDWLLQLKGGVSWHTLQRLALQPDALVALQVPLEDLEQLWRRHQGTHEPLQYLVGRCPWRDLELEVGPGVLIPRQETELLVELAVDLATEAGFSDGPSLWADLGTGSGCLALALAQVWRASQGFAIDLSEAALTQAHHNLERHGLIKQITVLQGSWWEPLRPHWGALQLVVANPPYIPERVWATLDPVVRMHEPKLALSGGEDGLRDIRAIGADAAAALAPGGLLLLEHHHDQSAAVLSLLAGAGLNTIRAHRDLEGKQRFVSARAPFTP